MLSIFTCIINHISFENLLATEIADFQKIIAVNSPSLISEFLPFVYFEQSFLELIPDITL